MSLVVRAARPPDAGPLMRLWHHSWLDTYQRPDLGVTRAWIEEEWAPRLSPAGIERFAARLAREGGPEGTTADASGTRSPAATRSRTLLAELDGALAGLGAAHHDPERGPVIGALHVDAAVHRRGVGSALLAALLDGIDPREAVHLEVASYNANAIAFYERAGFRRVPGSDSLYDGRMPEFWMTREPVDGM